MKYVVNTYYDPIPEKPIELTPAQRTTLKTQLKAFLSKPRSWDDIAHAARGKHPMLQLGIVREILGELVADGNVKTGTKFPDPSTIVEVEPT